MRLITRPRPIVFTLAILAVLAAAGPLSAGPLVPFQATGAFVNTGHQGNVFSGTISGQCVPPGAFTGGFSQIGTGGNLSGAATLVFGNDTLSIVYNLALDRRTNTFSGTYLVKGGTGNLTGASGGGAMWTSQGPTGTFALNGTISR
jgi:hypothetical protein